MSDDLIRKALGMSEDSEYTENALVRIDENGQEIVENVELDAEIEEDAEMVRENLVDLVATTNEAISELLKVAKQSQHPRAYEVLANLIKTSADVNNDILGVHKRKNDLKGKKVVQSTPHSKGVANVTNNNLFVGSTADLQAFLLEQQKKKEEE